MITGAFSSFVLSMHVVNGVVYTKGVLCGELAVDGGMAWTKTGESAPHRHFDWIPVVTQHAGDREWESEVGTPGQ